MPVGREVPGQVGVEVREAGGVQGQPQVLQGIQAKVALVRRVQTGQETRGVVGALPGAGRGRIQVPGAPLPRRRTFEAGKGAQEVGRLAAARLRLSRPAVGVLLPQEGPFVVGGVPAAEDLLERPRLRQQVGLLGGQARPLLLQLLVARLQPLQEGGELPVGDAGLRVAAAQKANLGLATCKRRRLLSRSVLFHASLPPPQRMTHSTLC